MNFPRDPNWPQGGRGNYITFYSILSTDLLVSHHLVCQLHNLPALIFLPHSLAQLAWLFQHHWRRGYNGSPAGELRGPCVEFVHQGSPGASEERWAVRTTGEDLLSQDYETGWGSVLIRISIFLIFFFTNLLTLFLLIISVDDPFLFC